MSDPHARISPLTLLLCAVIGLGGGLLIQTYRSGSGLAPLSPPASLPASLLVIAIMLFILAKRLKAYLSPERKAPVNPFHAVRLLAAGRASQFTGSLFAGFGAGLFVTVASRITQMDMQNWLNMLLTALTGALLLLAGIYAEQACRLPPEDGDENELSQEPKGTAPGGVSAYRAHDE